ncbi:hypothetical protein, partial [Pseudomonas marginalis]|uniref:hypothetical protein n=1 Tax=Pseudomonas marginalis TaxID=298 RepID=UPI001F38EC0F
KYKNTFPPTKMQASTLPTYPKISRPAVETPVFSHHCSNAHQRRVHLLVHLIYLPHLQTP